MAWVILYSNVPNLLKFLYPSGHFFQDVSNYDYFSSLSPKSPAAFEAKLFLVFHCLQYILQDSQFIAAIEINPLLFLIAQLLYRFVPKAACSAAARISVISRMIIKKRMPLT